MAVHWGGATAATAPGTTYTEVADYASLPAASAHTGEDYIVQTTTGTWLVNRHPAGLYRSNGTTWNWLGDTDTDASTISNTPAGNISSTTVQAAINELDTEKAIAGAATASGLTMATASVIYRKTAASGALEVNTLATLKTDLGLTGTNSGDQTITLTGAVTGSGVGSFATALTAASVVSAVAAQALAPASVAATGAVTSSGATNGIGYATGAGGAISQGTSRTTGVILSKICGQITLFSAAGSTTYNTFTVTNTTVAAGDVIEVSQQTGANLYNVLVTNVASGSFKLSVSAVSGTATEAPVINFAVMKAVAA